MRSASWVKAASASLRVKSGRCQKLRRAEADHCLSYSPLFTRLRTVKPAFLASDTERARGELKVEKTLRTGFLQAGHWARGAADRGRRRVNLPPHTLHSPSRNSYS